MRQFNRIDDSRLIKVLKALADPKRFQMMQEVAAAGELSCGQLGERFPLAQPTISHHLKILSDAGLLVVREKGQHHFISLDRALISSILDLLPKRLAHGSAKQVRRGRKLQEGTGLAR